MGVYTGEITSSDIASDNPIHQRLFFGYFKSQDYVKGDILELGCGTGRGLEILLKAGKSYTALDKNQPLIREHQRNYPKANFINANMPPFKGVADGSVDSIVTFHVIEHIEDHEKFVSEIYRVLRPNGIAVISTPNKRLRLARNPWHVREYFKSELETLVKTKFKNVEMLGIAGNEKAMAYFEENRKSVDKIMKYDFLKLQYALPAALLRKPYEYLNRRNRNKLMDENTSLASEIDYTDYFLSENDEQCLDHFFICRK